MAAYPSMGDKSGGGYEKYISQRGFPGMGDGMIPGFGRRSLGYGKRSFGQDARSFGYGKRSFGYGKRSFGYGKKRSFMPDKRSFGYGKRSFGYGTRSFIPDKRSFGYGTRSFMPDKRSFGYGTRSFMPDKRSFGFGTRSFGLKKREGNDMNTRDSSWSSRGLLSTSPVQETKESSFGSMRNDPDDSSEYPGDNERASISRESGLGDFGGGFSNYMKMLEGDPISENQDLQGDVFGGGMSGKYWDMNKEEDLDEPLEDEELLGEMDEEKRNSRQAAEVDQPEDAPNSERTLSDESTDTYVVAFKSPKAQVLNFYNQLKEAISHKDNKEIHSLLSTLESQKLSKKESLNLKRKLMIIDDEELMDKDDVDAHEHSLDEPDIQSKFEEFIEKMNKNIPDPIMIKTGIPSNLKKVSIGGLSDFKVIGKVHKGLGRHWKGTVSLPSLLTSVTSTSSPAVPFSGKVIGIFKGIRIHMTFKVSEDGSIHVSSVRSTTKQMKFVPKFDSSVPLNPWSKVSMSGYLMSRIKKYIPSVVDKTILRLTHVIEGLEKD
eukprot:TRINITY_DN472_c0_g1_i3.p1 TRINITY_DN472_c0_g1~~TRINITY_DN472_c0_g1_i3.p1  ORF type:complete len:609 (+),score=137.92 TRINITY_DN472_c0_g1_i3:194-1828(+)